MIVYILGGGYAPSLRSLLSSLVPDNHLSILFTTVALFEGLASILFTTILSLSFAHGIERGGSAVALPFFVSASLYAIAVIGVWYIRPRH